MDDELREVAGGRLLAGERPEVVTDRPEQGSRARSRCRSRRPGLAPRAGSMPSRGWARAKQIAAMGENSGPTTIAPTIRIGWSVIRPAPEIKGRERHERDEGPGGVVSRRVAAARPTPTPPRRRAPPGATRSARVGLVAEDRVHLVDADRAPVLQVQVAQELDHVLVSSTGHVSEDGRQPSGFRNAPGTTRRFVTVASPSRTSTTRSVRSSGTRRRRCSTRLSKHGLGRGRARLDKTDGGRPTPDVHPIGLVWLIPFTWCVRSTTQGFSRARSGSTERDLARRLAEARRPRR